MVEKFFKDVQMMPQVSDAQMAASMTDLSMVRMAGNVMGKRLTGVMWTWIIIISLLIK